MVAADRMAEAVASTAEVVAFMVAVRFAGAVGTAAGQWDEVVSAEVLAVSAVREASAAPTAEQEDSDRAGTEALRAVLMAAGARTAARIEAPARAPSDREALADLPAGLAAAVRAR